MKGKDWLLLAVALAVAGVCARLGVWQLDRLSQRRARNALVAAALAQPPIELGAGDVAADSALRHRVRARGVYDFAHERVRPGRFYDGMPGVAVLTPLRLADGRAVFVDRGWAATPDARTIPLQQYREADTADIVGLGVAMPRGPGDADPAHLADSLPYPLLPYGIQLVSSDAATMLRRWPVERLNDGPHLGYAVQWFSFAIIVLVGTGFLLRKASRKGVEEKRQGGP